MKSVLSRVSENLKTVLGLGIVSAVGMIVCKFVSAIINNLYYNNYCIEVNFVCKSCDKFYVTVDHGLHIHNFVDSQETNTLTKMF